MGVSFAILFCIACWAAIVAGPVVIAFMMNRRQRQRSFINCVREVGGVLIRDEDSSGSTLVRIPYDEFEVSGAFFSSNTHWFGREVLELHFALPPSEAQVYYCCNCRSGKQSPEGWMPLTPYGRSGRQAAATNHPDSQKLCGIGLDSTFDELLRTKPTNQCRIAIDHSTLVLLVTGFGGYANMGLELKRVLAIGAQMSRQIWMVLDGSIELADAQQTAIEEQTCPVCSCIVEDPIICERCKTPHCRECWTYNGDSCGVFACGGRTAQRASR